MHVVYGLVGLKTHSKITLVVRREDGGLRRYLHLATGNYNAVTAGIYTDCGLLTCDPEMGADATELFNTLTGYSTQRSYRSLLVAPGSMRERIEELIEREIEHAQAGRGGRLIFKMNALVDDRLIRQLYQASQAGVQIDLIIRGICCLRPGLPGVSENIRVISIVGRFLEHSRIYYFGNGGEPEVYLGSADLMPRNLDRRVEIIFPVQGRSAAHLSARWRSWQWSWPTTPARVSSSPMARTSAAIHCRASPRSTARRGCWRIRRRAATARSSQDRAP